MAFDGNEKLELREYNRIKWIKNVDLFETIYLWYCLSHTVKIGKNPIVFNVEYLYYNALVLHSSIIS